jgi:adenylate cyclase
MIGDSAGWSLGPTAAWLLREAWSVPRSTDLVDELCRRLLGEGVPLWRLSLFFRTLHPEVFGDRFQWRRDTGVTAYDAAPRSVVGTPTFVRSPLISLQQGHEPFLRRRLVGPEAQLDFPMLEDLRSEGAADYLAFKMPFQDGSNTYLTTSTDAADGFSDRDVGLLSDIALVLARVAESQAVRSVATRLLDIYVGREAGSRIMGGQIVRGSGETIRAAIWLADLRDFTALTERLPQQELIAVLNDFFDRLAVPVTAEGGEILKFIGDAMLAIFPVRDGDDAAAARHALNAARAALAAMRAPGRAPLRCGIALHLGEVIYGNVGAAARLDFTVIGPAVNVAARIGGLCRPLDRELLVSARFAELCGSVAHSLGRHAMHGVDDPMEVFTL